VDAVMPEAPMEAPAPGERVLPGEIVDDRPDLGPEDRVLLIIDNDEGFARFLLEMAHENGFKAVIAMQGAEGIALAHRHRIDAITLDIRLPVIDGWRVLDRLKNDLDTRHIPVYLITTEEDAARALSRCGRRPCQADQGEGDARWSLRGDPGAPGPAAQGVAAARGQERGSGEAPGFPGSSG